MPTRSAPASASNSPCFRVVLLPPESDAIDDTAAAPAPAAGERSAAAQHSSRIRRARSNSGGQLLLRSRPSRQTVSSPLPPPPPPQASAAAADLLLGHVDLETYWQAFPLVCKSWRAVFLARIAARPTVLISVIDRYPSSSRTGVPRVVLSMRPLNAVAKFLPAAASVSTIRYSPVSLLDAAASPSGSPSSLPSPLPSSVSVSVSPSPSPFVARPIHATLVCLMQEAPLRLDADLVAFAAAQIKARFVAVGGPSHPMADLSFDPIFKLVRAELDLRTSAATAASTAAEAARPGAPQPLCPEAISLRLSGRDATWADIAALRLDSVRHFHSSSDLDLTALTLSPSQSARDLASLSTTSSSSSSSSSSNARSSITSMCLPRPSEEDLGMLTLFPNLVHLDLIGPIGSDTVALGSPQALLECVSAIPALKTFKAHIDDSVFTPAQLAGLLHALPEVQVLGGLVLSRYDSVEALDGINLELPSLRVLELGLGQCNVQVASNILAASSARWFKSVEKLSLDVPELVPVDSLLKAPAGVWDKVIDLSIKSRSCSVYAEAVAGALSLAPRAEKVVFVLVSRDGPATFGSFAGMRSGSGDRLFPRLLDLELDWIDEVEGSTEFTTDLSCWMLDSLVNILSAAPELSKLSFMKSWIDAVASYKASGFQDWLTSALNANKTVSPLPQSVKPQLGFAHPITSLEAPIMTSHGDGLTLLQFICSALPNLRSLSRIHIPYRAVSLPPLPPRLRSLRVDTCATQFPCAHLLGLVSSSRSLARLDIRVVSPPSRFSLMSKPPNPLPQAVALVRSAAPNLASLVIDLRHPHSSSPLLGHQLLHHHHHNQSQRQHHHHRHHSPASTQKRQRKIRPVAANPGWDTATIASLAMKVSSPQPHTSASTAAIHTPHRDLDQSRLHVTAASRLTTPSPRPGTPAHPWAPTPSPVPSLHGSEDSATTAADSDGDGGSNDDDEREFDDDGSGSEVSDDDGGSVDDDTEEYARGQRLRRGGAGGGGGDEVRSRATSPAAADEYASRGSTSTVLGVLQPWRSARPTPAAASTAATVAPRGTKPAVPMTLVVKGVLTHRGTSGGVAGGGGGMMDGAVTVASVVGRQEGRSAAKYFTAFGTDPFDPFDGIAL